MVIKLNRRYREILNTILNIDGCITGKELAEQCSVSIRTIREDIKGINGQLQAYGIRIDAVVKKGYCLTDDNKQQLLERNIIKKVLDNDFIAETPTSPKDRQMYILAQLTSKACLFADELADALHVSQSTINNDILLVKKWLKANLNLEMRYSLHNGITLKADERDRWNIIGRILAARLNASTIAKYWHYVFWEEDITKSSAALYHIVKAKTNENGYYLSGHSSQFFCLEMLVAANRHQAGFKMTAGDPDGACLSDVMKGIRGAAEEYLAVHLPDEEWCCLQQCFESKQFLYGTNLEKLISPEAITIVDAFLGAVADRFQISLHSNKEAREKLLLYAGPMIKRTRLRHCIANQLNASGRLSQQREYAMAEEMGKLIKRELHLELDPIETAYLTVHLEAMNKLWKRKLRTAIVCDYDESIISLIRETVEACFGDRLAISRTYAYQDFMYEEKESLEEIDFVISTSTIAAITDKSFVIINPLMEAKDSDSISESLDNHKIFRESGK